MTRSLVPTATNAVMTLMVAIVVMCLLATLALAGVLLVNDAARGWRSAVGTEFTVQLKPKDGVDMESALAQIAAAAKHEPGVLGARVLSLEETKKLLEPWLGSGKMLDELPMPRLVAISIDPLSPPDEARLTAAITAAAPGATLDTHRQWQGEVLRLATLLQWLGNGIIAVILVASALLVVYTARSAIDATRETIEVLYLAGASDGFIVRAVQSRFVAVALKAAGAGTLAAVVVLVLLAIADGLGFDDRIPAAIRTLAFGGLGPSIAFVGKLLLAPAGIVLVTIVTAHLAIGRILRQLF